jgi:hypothetical protein
MFFQEGGGCPVQPGADTPHTSRRRTPPGYTQPSLQDAIRQFDVELAQFGPNLQELLWKKGKVRA